MESIAKVQAEFPQDRAKMARCNGWTEAADVGKVDGLIRIPTDAEMVDGLIRIPTDAEQLLVIAHAGAMGHRGAEATKKALSEVTM
jgi:hypothetical protein